MPRPPCRAPLSLLLLLVLGGHGLACSPSSPPPIGPTDSDGDTIEDGSDNCPSVPNPLFSHGGRADAGRGRCTSRADGSARATGNG